MDGDRRQRVGAFERRRRHLAGPDEGGLDARKRRRQLLVGPDAHRSGRQFELPDRVRVAERALEGVDLDRV
ncbi:hypothetical protein [Natronomonas sp.]|uniref:hypothetical protein n=1 Tax=Natronomonas sp. TaxID=2184060 RepID=UPI0026353C91|nr:hypothetical protein [Natronomonas sp.]